ncbi:OmpA family protein [Dongshaea marina]|uniref:OmpA family protein n=1 Tax=Dongshaea marina TaxID=2047966 RepID=UPI000D3E3195|nr:OmpA family protein [Dongshaea marina]
MQNRKLLFVATSAALLTACAAPKPPSINGDSVAVNNPTQVKLANQEQQIQSLSHELKALKQGKTEAIKTHKPMTFIVNYPANSAQLKMTDELRYDVLRAARKGKIIYLLGRTDGQRPSEKDREMALKRAQGVRDYLVDSGIEATRIYVNYASATDYADNNWSRLGRYNNRRVEIEIYTDAAGKTDDPAPVVKQDSKAPQAAVDVGALKVAQTGATAQKKPAAPAPEKVEKVTLTAAKPDLKSQGTVVTGNNQITLNPVPKLAAPGEQNVVSVAEAPGSYTVYQSESYLSAIGRWMVREGYPNVIWSLDKATSSAMTEPVAKELLLHGNLQTVIAEISTQIGHPLHLQLFKKERAVALHQFSTRVALFDIKSGSLRKNAERLAKVMGWSVPKDAWRVNFDYPINGDSTMIIRPGYMTDSMGRLLQPYRGIQAQLVQSNHSIFFVGMQNG